MSTQDAITVESITCRANGREILSDVSFTLRRGELLGVIGPNGAGKSTLLKCILRIMKPSSGEVRIGGVPLSSMKPTQLARSLAFVPQTTEFTFPFTVIETVLMGRTPFAGRLRPESTGDFGVCRGCLRAVGMEELERRTITSLSGGERQLVVIARALAQEADFLLLDEPTANLDIHHRLTIMKLMAKIAGEGKGVIAVLHDLSLALRFATKLILLDGGRVRAYGTPEEVIKEELIGEVFKVRIHLERNCTTGEAIVDPLEPL
jgi:iron complex transport system ATP-binding protein